MTFSTNIPSELVYQIEENPRDLVVSRIESSRTTGLSHSPISNPVLRFELSTTNFVDLSTVQLYCNITNEYTKGGGSSSAFAGTASAAEISVPSTMDLFNTITVSTGSGQILQTISEAHVVNRILTLTASNDYLETAGSFSNISLNPLNRRRINGGQTQVRVDALQCLGFLKCGKFINPSSLGNLVFTFQMNPNSSLYHCDALDSVNCVLSQATMYWEECIMSPSYIESYNEVYLKNGYQLMYQNYATQTLTLSAGSTSQSVNFNMNISRCKALLTAIRPDSAISNQASQELAFTSSGLVEYSYMLGSMRVPQQPISSYVRSYQELLRIAYMDDSCMCDLPSFARFSTDYTKPSTTTQQINGCFVAGVDLEKYGSTNKSGIPLSGSSQFIVNWSSLAASKAVVVAVHDVGVSIKDQRILVEH